MAEENFYKHGLQFTCLRCSRCCRYEPGYVFLSQKDCDRLTTFLRISERKFIKKYCRWIELFGFSRLSLKEKSNYDCIFWRDGGCTVYSARPLQCMSFPFWGANIASRDDWNAAGKSCPGINKGRTHSYNEIESWLTKRNTEPFLEKM